MATNSKKNMLLTALGLLTAAGILAAIIPAQSASGRPDDAEDGDGATNDPHANLPMELKLTGVIRDFKERSVDGGHPDFERRPAGGFGHYMGNIAAELDSDGKPVFVGGGHKVSTQWRDASGRGILPALFDSSMGDSAGSFTGGADPGGIQSQDTFRQWFRSVPNVNMSKDLTITLRRAEGSNVYVFDDRQDPAFSNLGGFFPINNDLFGNSANESKNFHFTYELNTEFIYKPGQGQTFTFIGDDDVFVFINDQLVIDIGGVHAAVTQTVHLDRLDFLVPNAKNSLKFFFAERHRTQSNFRIETTLNLRSAELPNTAKLYD